MITGENLIDGAWQGSDTRLASADLDGVTVRIPSATRNFAVDGHVPKPH